MGSIATKRINRIYDHLEAEMARLQERCDEYGECILSVILEARQKVEMAKVPAFVETISDLYDEGNSVVCFVNFTNTIHAISKALKHRKELRLTCLSVGHGQAIVISLPDGKGNILFDAGSLTMRNPGRSVVTPFLRHRGIDTLDSIIISHDDIDHLNGIPEIITDVKVRKILANNAVLKIAQTLSSAGFLRQILEQQDLEYYNM